MDPPTQKFRLAIQAALRNPEIAPRVMAVLEEVGAEKVPPFVSRWKRAYDEIVRRGVLGVGNNEP